MAAGRSPRDGGREAHPLGVYGRLGDVEEPRARGRPEPKIEPLGWDFERSPVPTFTRLPPAPGIVYAELPLRAAAFLIDLTIVSVGTGIVRTVLEQVLNVVFPPASEFAGISLRMVVQYLAIPILLYAAVSAAASVAFWSRYRASPGQMVLGLFTVTQTDGLPLARNQALLRWLLLFGPAALLTGSTAIILGQFSFSLSQGDQRIGELVAATIALSALAWYGLLAWTIARDRRGRGLHDRLAGSVVVRREGSPS